MLIKFSEYIYTSNISCNFHLVSNFIKKYWLTCFWSVTFVLESATIFLFIYKIQNLQVIETFDYNNTSCTWILLHVNMSTITFFNLQSLHFSLLPKRFLLGYCFLYTILLMIDQMFSIYLTSGKVGAILSIWNLYGKMSNSNLYKMCGSLFLHKYSILTQNIFVMTGISQKSFVQKLIFSF